MFFGYEEPLEFLNVVQSWKEKFFNSKRKFIEKKIHSKQVLEIRNTYFTTYCIFFKFSEFEYSFDKFENLKNLRDLKYPGELEIQDLLQTLMVKLCQLFWNESSKIQRIQGHKHSDPGTANVPLRWILLTIVFTVKNSGGYAVNNRVQSRSIDYDRS